MLKRRLPDYRRGVRFPTFVIAFLLIGSGFLDRAFAQTQTYSDPVGFIGLTIEGTNNPGVPAYSLLGLGLTQIPSLCGVVGTTSGTQVPLESTLTPGQYNSVSNGPLYYIEVTSGTSAGFTDDIVSNDAVNVYTANDDSSVITNGSSYKLYPHWTIASAFGATDQAGLQAGTDSSADQILVQNLQEQIFSTYYYATASKALSAGWKCTGSGNANASQTPLYNNQCLFFNRQQGTNLAIRLVGAVKLGPTIIPLYGPGNQLPANVYATSTITLSNSGLYTDGISTDSLVAGTTSSADLVLIHNDAAGLYNTYYYATASKSLSAGWKNAGTGNTDASQTTIPLGSCLLIQFQSGHNGFNWKEPAPAVETSSACMDSGSCTLAVIDIEQEAVTNILLTWTSCTDQVYGVFSSGDLSNWIGQTALWGNDGTTSWTDTTTSGVTNRFYKIVGIPSNLGFNGDAISSGWALDNGLNPLDPTIDSETSTNPWAHGLTNLQVYQNPSVLIADNYDSVSDGIPDWWRVTYFSTSTTTNNNSCGTCDPDGDGINNTAEYLGGTNPTIPDLLASPTYQMIDLGTFAENSGDVSSLNASNWVVGTSGNEAFLAKPNEGVTLIGTLGGSSSDSLDINDLGQIVGDSYTTGDNFIHAFLWNAGSMTDLGVPTGECFIWSVAYGINNSSLITGYCTYSTGTCNEADSAFVYTSGTMQDIGGSICSPRSYGTYGIGVNSNSQVLLEAECSTSTFSGFIYQGGSVNNLGALPVYNLTSPVGINNLGDIVGTAVFDDMGDELSHAFLYHNGTMYDLNNLIATNTGVELANALAINDSGWILCLDSFGGGCLYKNGSITKLGDAVVGLGTIDLSFTGGNKSINNSGVIAAVAYSNGVAHAVILTPIPEFVRETQPGNGQYADVGSVGLPIFQPDSGTGRGAPPIPSGISGLTIQLSSNLGTSTASTMSLLYEDATTEYTNTLSETGSGSGIFTDGAGTSVIIDSPSLTTPGAVDTLNVQFNSSGLGLTNVAYTLLESDTNSLNFASALIHAELTMSGPLDSNAVDTIELQLDSEVDSNFFDGTLTETAVNSQVFTDGNGHVTLTFNSLTSLATNQQATAQITVQNNFLTLTNVTMTLIETATNSLQFSNLGLQPQINVTPKTPTMAGEGVFRVRVFGSSTGTNTISVILSNSVNQVSVPAIRASGNLFMTDKLVLLPNGSTETYSGATVILADNGPLSATAQSTPLGAATVNLHKQAFVGVGLFHFLGGSWNPVAIPDVKNNGAQVESILTNNLGYTVLRDESLTKADVTSALPNSALWYSFVHGNALGGPFTHFYVFAGSTFGLSYGGQQIVASDISTANGTNVYDLVFINGCNSADQDPGSQVSDFISAFNAKAYVGWQGPVQPETAAGASVAFFHALDNTNTVGVAAQAVKDLGEPGADMFTVSAGPNIVIDLTP